MTAKQKIQALINAANETTGEIDLDLTTAVKALIAGYGGGSDVRPLAYSGSLSSLPANLLPASFGNYNYFSSVALSKPGTLVAGNIKKGVAILGVTGTYEGSGSAEPYAWIRAYTNYENMGDSVSCSALGMVSPADATSQYIFSVPAAGTYRFVVDGGMFTTDHDVTVTGKYSMVSFNIDEV